MQGLGRDVPLSSPPCSSKGASRARDVGQPWGPCLPAELHPADDHRMPRALAVPFASRRLSTQIHQERIKLTLLSPGKPNANIARAVRLAQAHRSRELALAFACPSLVRLQSRAEKRCFWSRSKCVLRSCLNIAQGNRNAGQSSEHNKNNMGPLLTAQHPCLLCSQIPGILGRHSKPGLVWSQGACRVPNQAGT